MADYKAIKGIGVKSIAGDPTGLTGHVWYDSDANAFQVFKTVGAWATGGTLNAAHARHANMGSQTAALAAGGYNPPTIGLSEEYNGVDWTEGNNLQGSRTSVCGLGGTGSQTAGLAAGGGPPVSTNTEEYDGTTWAETADLGTGAYGKGMCGTQTAGLCFGGYTAPLTVDSEEYNGTGWTEGNNLNEAKGYNTGMGTQTAGLMCGGGGVEVEAYDGTSWSEVAEVSNERENTGGFGIQTAAIVAGDPNAPTDVTEEYNGTSWATQTELLTGRGEMNGGAGTVASGLCCGGGNPFVALTEEWTKAATAQAITSS